MAIRLSAATAVGAVAAALSAVAPAGAFEQDLGGARVTHVLLISIDGMHAVDFQNCANGVSGVNGGAPYCPNLAALAAHGTT